MAKPESVCCLVLVLASCKGLPLICALISLLFLKATAFFFFFLML